MQLLQDLEVRRQMVKQLREGMKLDNGARGSPKSGRAQGSPNKGGARGSPSKPPPRDGAPGFPPDQRKATGGPPPGFAQKRQGQAPPGFDTQAAPPPGFGPPPGFAAPQAPQQQAPQQQRPVAPAPAPVQQPTRPQGAWNTAAAAAPPRPAPVPQTQLPQQVHEGWAPASTATLGGGWGNPSAKQQQQQQQQHTQQGNGWAAAPSAAQGGGWGSPAGGQQQQQPRRSGSAPSNGGSSSADSPGIARDGSGNGGRGGGTPKKPTGEVQQLNLQQNFRNQWSDLDPSVINQGLDGRGKNRRDNAIPVTAVVADDYDERLRLAAHAIYYKQQGHKAAAREFRVTLGDLKHFYDHRNTECLNEEDLEKGGGESEDEWY